MIEKTNVYFLAEVTKNYGNGDCILLENIDINGNILHSLIDTGRKVYNGVVSKFLKKHNVKKLEFLLITHSHTDHNGDTVSIIQNYEIDKLIMKEFDLKWSPTGAQKAYEDIIIASIDKNIKKIIGVSYFSLISEEYSPTRSENFKNKVKSAKKENFEYFNKDNVIFKFGNSNIQIMNWEIFDSEGNIFIPLENKVNKKFRDIYKGENQNSLGVLLTQGNKKVFFSGDMNNIGKNVSSKIIGDEDRLKELIGKVNLLKLGHHGYQHSNTKDYLNVLKPEYAIITNDIDNIFIETEKYLENNKVNYLYSTYDIYEINAVITNDNIELGFGTEGIKKVREKNIIFHKKINLNYELIINYNSIEINVNNWKELKTEIEKNKKNGIKKDNNIFNITALKINLNSDDTNNCYIPDSCIDINQYQKVILTTDKEIKILRGEKLVDYPLFNVENANLILGEKDMKGKIIIDGNKEKVFANSNLIKLISSEFEMHNNLILCNNHNKTIKRTKKSSNINLNKFYGSAIYSINSNLNIYGGEITNNIHEIYLNGYAVRKVKLSRFENSNSLFTLINILKNYFLNIVQYCILMKKIMKVNYLK